MADDSHHLSILTAREVDELFGLPRFTEEDRPLYFGLSPRECDAVDSIRTTSAAVHLVLQCGYFKAKKRFFVYEREAVLDDLRFIVRQYFPDHDLDTIPMLSKPTRLVQQDLILRLFDYRPCNGSLKDELERKMQRVAMLSTQPLYVLREALRYLESERVVAPGYSSLQDMVGRAVAGERQRVTEALSRALTSVAEEHLDALLQADEGIYRISALKHEAKDFSYRELRREVERRDFFHPLYTFAQSFLLTTSLSNESVKYYASLVQFYTVYKLQRMPEPIARHYLLCYAYHRFRQINDTLLEAFVHLVHQYEAQAKQAAEQAMHKALTDRNPGQMLGSSSVSA